MANYDDIFNASQSKENEEKSFTPFDKDEWAAQKKQGRAPVRAHGKDPAPKEEF